MNRNLTWERVGTESKDLVQSILDHAPQYRMNVDGVTEAPNDGEESLKAIPPHCSMEQKHFLVLRIENIPIGVADVIQNFPETATAFIGLFLLQEERQKRGLGKAAYQLLEQHIRTQLGSKKIRLAIVDSNPVQPFWEKMGFIATGETRPHEGVNKKSIKRVMEKWLG